ncbi:hypothetical protein [Muriicola jejuensis]|uniref:hypothetical protein n=1 Tax=Muriicola jejuensis TaxID=504488 RepID=UPI0013D2682C|nr:hypothetical protein [Muriicola jejuensis]
MEMNSTYSFFEWSIQTFHSQLHLTSGHRSGQRKKAMKRAPSFGNTHPKDKVHVANC